VAKQLKPAITSGESKGKGFRLYPSDTNRLTRISLNLLAAYLVIKVIIEVVYSNFLYLFDIDNEKLYYLYSLDDYWIVYLVMALVFAVIALNYFGKGNLGLIAAIATGIASYFESSVGLGNRTVSFVNYFQIVFDYSNYPNMNSAFLFLFTGNQLSGIILVVSIALLIAGREDLRKALSRNS
jgi:hypothetical protein